MSGRRVLAVWCPDWPAVAAARDADIPSDRPVVVMAGNRVAVCSLEARKAGVRRGMKKREVQSRCADIFVAQEDSHRDARLFEAVVAAVEEVAAGVEVLRPGVLALAARGVARFYGSEQAASVRVGEAVAAVGVRGQIGISEELFTAVFAARHAEMFAERLVAVPPIGVVAPGEGARFLAALPIGELAREPSFASPERAELVDLLCRLGLRKIGDFAALNSTDVGSRFGADALRAQRQARGEPERLPLARTPPEELFVEYRPDPPLERVDAAAFAARRLAAGLQERLTEAGGACTRLAIIAKTEAGEELSRIWRCAEPLTPAATADRIRWQLEGWLTHRAPDEGSPLVSLRLEPVEIVVAGELQLGLWGAEGKADERVRRVLTRVQSLLGPAAVRVGVRSGGRGPGEQVTTVAYGEELVPAAEPDLPWPGRILGPAPTVVFSDPPEVGVEAAGGARVWITDRGEFADRPAAVRWGGRRWPVTAWTRPWLLDERWWLPEGAQGVRVRAQFILGEQEKAILLCGCDKRWYLEGMYE